MNIRSRGWGPWREEWYSICSAHRGYKETCNLCNKGTWVNVYKQAAGYFIFERWPDLWRWWANRPWSPRRKKLEGWFPGLKGEKKDE